MRTPTQDQVVSMLQKRGYHFRRFEFSVEDPCRAEDLDWNYLDVVHPHFVHPHMTRCYSFVDAKGYSCIDLQRVLGFTMAQSVSTWVSGPNRITTQTVTMSLVIVVEVSFEDIGDNRGRTTTVYQVGSTSRLLLAVALPVLKWALDRNWKEFWRDDHKMRVRRGELREQGFEFAKPPRVHGIASTLKVSDNNVVVPPVPCTHEIARIELQHRDGRILQVGKSDHFGLQVVLKSDRVEIYPRLCPHEGACLDMAQAPSESAVQCPWHGRSFVPIVTLPYSHAPTTVMGPLHRFVLSESELRVEPLTDSVPSASIDWTASRPQTAVRNARVA